MIDKNVITAFDDFSRTVHDEKASLRKLLLGSNSSSAQGLNIDTELKNAIDVADAKLTALTEDTTSRLVSNFIKLLIEEAPQLRSNGKLIKNAINIIEPVTQELEVPADINTLDFLVIIPSRRSVARKVGTITLKLSNGEKVDFPTDQDIPLLVNLYGYMQTVDFDLSKLGHGYYVKTSGGLAKVEPGKLTQFVYASAGEEVSWPIPWPADYNLTAPIVSEGTKNINYLDYLEGRETAIKIAPATQDSKLFTAGDVNYPIIDGTGATFGFLDKEVISSNTKWREGWSMNSANETYTIPESEWMTDHKMWFPEHHNYNYGLCHLTVINKVVGGVREKSRINFAHAKYSGRGVVVHYDPLTYKHANSDSDPLFPDALTKITYFRGKCFIAKCDKASLGEVPSSDDSHSLGFVNGSSWGNPTPTVKHLMDIPIDVKIDNVYGAENSHRAVLILDQLDGSHYVILRNNSNAIMTKILNMSNYIVRPANMNGTFLCFEKNGMNGLIGNVSEGGIVTYKSFLHPLVDCDDILVNYSVEAALSYLFVTNNSKIDIYYHEYKNGKMYQHLTTVLPGNFTKVISLAKENRIKINAYTVVEKGQQLSSVYFDIPVRLPKAKHLIKCTGYGTSIL